MKKCGKCQQPFKVYVKINGKYHNLSNRKFCLNCSPYGQHNTKPVLTISTTQTQKQCPKCKKVYPLTSQHFYKHGKVGLGGYCKGCNTIVKVEQLRAMKSKCVEFLGGKCIKCEYSKCEAALDIHHKDPSKKEFAIAQSKSLKFSTIEKELKKCVLLCANCHREVHIGAAFI